MIERNKSRAALVLFPLECFGQGSDHLVFPLLLLARAMLPRLSSGSVILLPSGRYINRNCYRF